MDFSEIITNSKPSTANAYLNYRIIESSTLIALLDTSDNKENFNPRQLWILV